MPEQKTTTMSFSQTQLEALQAALTQGDALMLARHGAVAQHALTWPEAITVAEREAAVAQLKALGILVRQSA